MGKSWMRARCVLLIALLPPAVEAEAPVDLILTNGQVFTADPARPMVEAVAIIGERIVKVGTTNEVAALAGERTRTIDLQQRVVTPGFNDAHVHFGPDPKGYKVRFETSEPTWAETSAAIGAAVQKTAPGTWIFVPVGYTVVLDEAVTRAALDKLASDHPVLLRAYYGHGYVANSKALSLLHIANDEPDPAGGYYERVAASRELNGRYWEYAQWKTTRALAAAVSDDEIVAALHEVADAALRAGITSLQIFPAMPIERFVRLADKSDLPVRVRAIAFSPTTRSGRDLSEIRELDRLQETGSNVTVSGIKWILDGTPIERGAALRDDYADRPGWYGKLNFPERDIAAMLKESLELQQQLLLHAVGDKTADVVFDAMEIVNGGNVDWKSKRLRIEHGEGVIADLIPRARALGVVVVQNPSHFTFVELFRQRWHSPMGPLRSLIEADIPVALGSDGPMNPFLNIMFAITDPTNPPEAITREQAVRAYTSGSAFAEFAEQDKGTIAAGKLADIAVLSQDPFSVAVPDLPRTRSVLTIVGGKVVYEEH
jgi:predicted amidohydrolase YtcJ